MFLIAGFVQKVPFGSSAQRGKFSILTYFFGAQLTINLKKWIFFEPEIVKIIICMPYIIPVGYSCVVRITHIDQ
jgi:hypothetical protein